ncbi:unnamed protein product [Adineta ricciae]|uniref:Peptidase M20 dimerisation domain-containing protein n=1 Tax=Adineta ricciae TaxID=249248 RepID=A0A816ADX4_ADIRI|nr:unnamed protein product [Adineta ricciae]CAF1596441.1 unnamed protein product [Adineta ricciae]
MLSFLSDLIRLRSVCGVDAERFVAERICAECDHLKLKYDVISAPGQEHRPNVIVTAGNGPSKFLFVGHIDTVNVEDETQWALPPFGGMIDEKTQRMIGRGACDNKGGIVCALYTLYLLQQRIDQEKLNISIQLACVVDEESGACSSIGVRYLLDKKLISGDGAIYVYPGVNVTIGHRGLLRLAIDVIGENVHTGSIEWNTKKKGANAATALARILVALEDYPWENDTNPSFPNLTLTVTPGTIVNGGGFVSVVPSHASAMVDIRLMPSTSVDHVLQKIEDIATNIVNERNEFYRRMASDSSTSTRLSASITIKNQLPAATIDSNHPLVYSCVQAVEKILHVTPTTNGCGPANEGYMLIESGIPTICGFGPIGGNVHGVDEWVSVPSLAQTVDVYFDIVSSYCHLFQ